MMNYLQPGTNVLPAIANIIVGISAIVFNKYLASERSLSKMKKK
ncbi:hypothetical protein SDC9_183078 [bioreactor metagenome]|uniref:Uncharacterized protein n=1 Tax=bioreactor metagenome TaxID=1076179 RepID=A0A645HA33_9ZZZZ